MGILAFGWIQAVRCRGSETHLLATCSGRKVAEGHWMEMSAHTVWEIHVQFGVRRNSPFLIFLLLWLDFQCSRHQWSLPICLVNNKAGLQSMRTWATWVKIKQMKFNWIFYHRVVMYNIYTIVQNMIQRGSIHPRFKSAHFLSEESGVATWYRVQGLCRGLCRHSRATNQTWGSTWSYTAKDAKEASACFSSLARSEGLFFNFRVSQQRKDPKCFWLMSTSHAITVVVSEDIKSQTGSFPILGWCLYALDDIFHDLMISVCFGCFKELFHDGCLIPTFYVCTM